MKTKFPFSPAAAVVFWVWPLLFLALLASAPALSVPAGQTASPGPGIRGPENGDHDPFTPDPRSGTLSNFLVSVSGPVTVIHPPGSDGASAELAALADQWLAHLSGAFEKTPGFIRIILTDEISWKAISSAPWGSVAAGDDPSEAFGPAFGTRVQWLEKVLGAIPWERLSEAENGLFRKAFDFSSGRGYYTIRRGISESEAHHYDFIRAQLFLVIADSLMRNTRLGVLPDWARRMAAVALVLDFPDFSLARLEKWRILVTTVSAHVTAPDGWVGGGSAFLRRYDAFDSLETAWFDGKLIAALSGSGGERVSAAALLEGLLTLCDGKTRVSTKKVLEVIARAGVRFR